MYPMQIKRLQLFTIIIIAIIAIIVLAGATNITNEAVFSPQICPADFDYNAQGNKCYKVHKYVPRPWQGARLKCQSEGADLIVIHDEEKIAVIKQLMKKHLISGWSWLGLKKAENASTFKWVDDMPVVFEAWGPNDPNNGDSNKRQCAVITGEYHWFDEPCWKTFPYFCEKNVDISPVCSFGYVPNEQKSACYKIQLMKYEFNKARYMCQQEKGGDVVSISDTNTKNDITGVLYPFTKKIPRTWIGLRKNETEIEFQWLDGSSLNSSDLTFFDKPHSFHCAAFGRRGERYAYFDRPCTHKLQSICKSNNIISTTYPELDCPVGYTMFVMTNGWHTKCFLIENFIGKTQSEAEDYCSSQGGKLFTFNSETYEWKSLVGIDGIHLMDAYWAMSDRNSCRTYERLTGQFEEQSCESKFGYICTHWGYIRALINFEEVESIIGHNLGDDQKFHFVNDVCQSSNGIAVFAMDFLWPMLDDANLNCVDQNRQKECCVEVTLSKSVHLVNQTGVEMEFPIDKLSCLCPEMSTKLTSSAENIEKSTSPIQQNTKPMSRREGHTKTTSSIEHSTETESPAEQNEETTPLIEQNEEMVSPTEQNTEMTSRIEQSTETASPIEQNREKASPIKQETFDLLRNITAPKNDSGATNNLCPCRCDISKINFNPSPEVLSQIIFNIQKELKVEPEKLSFKRNKKMSAKDNRSESRAIGYVGIALCFIPLGLLVAMDILRLFQSI